MFTKKWKYKKLTATVLAVSMLSGCGAPAQPNGNEVPTAETQTRQETEHPSTPQTQEGQDMASVDTEVTLDLYMGRRPMLVGSLPQSVSENVTPQVTQYSIEPDLSNVVNVNQFTLARTIRSLWKSWRRTALLWREARKTSFSSSMRLTAMS